MDGTTLAALNLGVCLLAFAICKIFLAASEPKAEPQRNHQAAQIIEQHQGG